MASKETTKQTKGSALFRKSRIMSDSVTQTGNSLRSSNFLQRHVGNNYVQTLASDRSTTVLIGSKTRTPVIQRKCACGGTCTKCKEKEAKGKRIQPKLTIGPANDVYEQEADRVADQIMRMPHSSVHNENKHPLPGPTIQRATAKGNRAPNSGGDITLNHSGGQPLSNSTRQYMEPRFGIDFSHVQVHSDLAAQDTASQIHAKAFTHGPNIWLGKGAHEGDKRLIAHELTHVVQEDNGHSHFSDIQRKVVVNPDAAAANDILSQFRFLCTDVNFDRSGTTITGDSSSIATQSCECISDAVGDPGRTYTINVQTVTNTPRPETLHDGTTRTVPMPSSGPFTIPGTNPTINMPASTGSDIDFGAFRANGSAFVAPNWRILAHELCGHSRLNQASPGSKGNRPGHDATIDTENAIAAEHGGEVRGHFADFRQGESFHNPSGNSSRVVFKLIDGWHFEAP